MGMISFKNLENDELKFFFYFQIIVWDIIQSVNSWWNGCFFLIAKEDKMRSLVGVMMLSQRNSAKAEISLWLMWRSMHLCLCNFWQKFWYSQFHNPIKTTFALLNCQNAEIIRHMLPFQQFSKIFVNLNHSLEL